MTPEAINPVSLPLPAVLVLSALGQERPFQVGQCSWISVEGEVVPYIILWMDPLVYRLLFLVPFSSGEKKAAFLSSHISYSGSDSFNLSPYQLVFFSYPLLLVYMHMLPVYSKL